MMSTTLLPIKTSTSARFSFSHLWIWRGGGWNGADKITEGGTDAASTAVFVVQVAALGSLVNDFQQFVEIWTSERELHEQQQLVVLLPCCHVTGGYLIGCGWNRNKNEISSGEKLTGTIRDYNNNYSATTT